MTQIDGETYHVHGSEESIQWKWVYCPKQSIESMWSLSSYQWYFFRELEQIISQFLWKYKKPLIAKSILKKEEWNWRNQSVWFQNILQSHIHQDSMVLVQRHKYRSMEQNRKPRD